MPEHKNIPQGKDAVWMHYSELSPWADNPNMHPQFQPEAVAESIIAFGFVAPACIWRAKNRLVAGHGRLLAMQLLCETGYDYIDATGEICRREPNPGFTPIGAPSPGYMRVIYHDFTGEAVANAYAMADNELARSAKMDEEATRKLLKAVQADETFDALHAIGFDHNKLQELIAETDNASFLDGLLSSSNDGKSTDNQSDLNGNDGGSGGSGKNTTNRAPTLVDLVTPLSVAERAKCHGVINMAKRLLGVTTQREAVIAIFDFFENKNSKDEE